MEELRRNAPAPIDCADDDCVLEYYRHCRNWVVHPGVTTFDAARKYFVENGAILAAGNPRSREPEQLVFDDLKRLARAVLSMGQVVSESFDPGDEAIAKTVPTDRWSRFRHEPARFHKAAVGYLVTEWGLESSRAERVVSMFPVAD